MKKEFSEIIPSPPSAADEFATYQLTYEFRREVAYREDFQEYCEWYRRAARQHQQELAKMRHDINILRWFLSWRS